MPKTLCQWLAIFQCFRFLIHLLERKLYEGRDFGLFCWLEQNSEHSKHSKCSINNCWMVWINEGSCSASKLHFSPSFIEKPQPSQERLERAQWFTTCFSVLTNITSLSPKWYFKSTQCPYVLNKNSSIIQSKGGRYTSRLCSWCLHVRIHVIYHEVTSMHVGNFARIWRLRSVYKDGATKHSYFLCFSMFWSFFFS